MLQPVIAFTTCPDEESAEKVIRGLLEQKLAACVNVVPQVTSWYMWEGKLEKQQEFKLVIKTVLELAHQVEERIKAEHPYKTPEITMVEMAAIAEDYFAWMQENLDLTQQN